MLKKAVQLINDLFTFFVLIFVVMETFEMKLDYKNHEFEFSKIYIVQYVTGYLIIGDLSYRQL